MKYGRYNIVKELGKGAMGVVYQAHDPDIDRMVALKVLREDRMTSEDFLKRFLKEAQAIGRLSHPNIVTVYDIGQDRNTVFIAMEFLEGAPLDKIIKERKPQLAETLRIGAQIAMALDYAHKRGIVHRDIKPSNIILTPDGQVKITDFGIARIEDPAATKLTQAGQILGTPVYMSPEQVIGHEVDGRSDLYSLGVILYELAAGKRPYGGKTLPTIFRAITDQEPLPPEQLQGTIPKPVSRLILKSIEKEPENRFPTGNEFADAIKKCNTQMAEKTIEASSQKPEEKTEVTTGEDTGKRSGEDTGKSAGEDAREMKTQMVVKKKSRLPVFILLGVIIIVIGVAAGIFLRSEGKKETPVSPPEITLPEKKTPPADVPAKLPPPETQKALTLLNVESDPVGADVFVDGALKGNTPLSLNLPMGKYEIRIEKENFYEWEAQVELKDEGPMPLFVRLHSSQ